MAFQKKIARLQRAVRGAVKVAEEAQSRIDHIRSALLDTPAADHALLTEIHTLQQRLNGIRTNLRGDRTRSNRREPTPASINQRVSVAIQWNVTSAPTQTQRDAYRHAGTEFTKVLADLRDLIESGLAGLEHKLEQAGAPWTPGRIPEWTME
jgi:Mg2+ and Co2+ transporter CorA